MNDDKEVGRLLALLFDCARRRIKPKVSDEDGKLTITVQGVEHHFNYELNVLNQVWFLEG
jgi:hypothetical protein